MKNEHSQATTFINRLSDEVFNSTAVNHPYLQALGDGNFPDINYAFKDFALQYGLYNTQFISYLSAVIGNLSSSEHRKILESNLAEEEGHIQDIDLPPDVLASIKKQSHTQLYSRFQEALGVDSNNSETIPENSPGLVWSHHFLHLCEMNEYVGVGAIGIGTELIVSKIYNQILLGLETHSNLTLTQRVFFDLHSECDEEHAAQLLSIAKDLGNDNNSCEQIEYGVTMAIKLRSMFWDNMLERAQNFSATSTLNA
ncbi:MAG: iron-containing redox enzyme family protein [Pseudomonadota bacterium]